MKLELFLIRKADLWGDYGDVLTSGYAAREPATCNLLLNRSGPFVPPISFPDSNFGRVLVVTDSLRQQIEAETFGSIGFKPVVKERIVHLPYEWEKWDRNADLPRVIPEGGEPENYIMDQSHSDEIAAQMPILWEAVPPVLHCDVECEDTFSFDKPEKCYFTPSGEQYRGLFRNREDWFDLIADKPTKQWLAKTAGEWLTFAPLIERL